MSTQFEQNTSCSSIFELIHLCANPVCLPSFIKSVTDFFQQYTGCQAVGVRLKDGIDFPYYETRGFPAEFILAENTLCAYDVWGELIRDDQGNPVIECMCGNILCGRTDASKPFFTPKGSFWSNCTTELLASTSDKERLTHTRNRCNSQGYETVVLIPLRWQGQTFGLFQFNDTRKGYIKSEQVMILEKMVECVAITLAKLEADKALHQSEEKFHLISKLAPAGIYIADPDGKCLYANPFWCQMAGLTLEEALGTGWIDGIHPEDRNSVFANWKKMVESEGEWTTEYRFQNKKTGQISWVYGLAAPQRKPDGTILLYIGVNIDVTERKQSEEFRERLLGELHSKSDDLENIIFISSHDLKSPLVNIHGFASELERGLNEVKDIIKTESLTQTGHDRLSTLLHTEIPESLNFIKHSSKKMDTLLNGLLHLSRIGTAKLNTTTIDMNKLFDSILTDLEFKIRENNIDIKIQETLPPCAGDQTLINEVFSNLVDNAIKYRSAHRPCTIRIYGQQKNNCSFYQVQDNGIGIPEKHKEKVFEIFHQLSPSAEGQGLGLTLVHRILKRLGGQIELDSEPDKGTTMSVALPVS